MDISTLEQRIIRSQLDLHANKARKKQTFNENLIFVVLLTLFILDVCAR